MVFYLEQVLDLVLAKYASSASMPNPSDTQTKNQVLRTTSLIEILKPRGTHEEPKMTWKQHMGTACHEKSNREGLPRLRTALPCSWESSLRLNCEYSTKSALICGFQEVVFYLEQVLRPSLSEVCQ